jgi:hypothetical protein
MGASTITLELFFQVGKIFLTAAHHFAFKTRRSESIEPLPTRISRDSIALCKVKPGLLSMSSFVILYTGTPL